MKKDLQRHKRYYDRKANCVVLIPDDSVLVRKKLSKGKHKITDKWESIPYVVVQKSV